MLLVTQPLNLDFATTDTRSFRSRGHPVARRAESFLAEEIVYVLAKGYAPHGVPLLPPQDMRTATGREREGEGMVPNQRSLLRLALDNLFSVEDGQEI